MPSGTLKKTHPIQVPEHKMRTRRHHWWQRRRAH
jgi:hypothetical protein